MSKVNDVAKGLMSLGCLLLLLPVILTVVVLGVALIATIVMALFQ